MTTNRLKIYDGVVESCKAYSSHDIDLAYRWAVKVLELASESPELILTPDELQYIEAVISDSQN